MADFKFDNIDVNKITTGYFQVALQNAGAKIDELEHGIKAQGLLQPIGVAKSKITEESDEYEWEVLWGQRRHLVFMRLGHQTIPAMVLDKVLTKEEGMAYALQENIARRDMSRKDIYDAIKLIWIQFGDEKKCADEAGIPLPLVRDALKSEQVNRLKNGRAIYDHATNECGLPAATAHKILDNVKKADNVSADLRKGKKLANVLSVADVQLRNKILKAAQNTPDGDVDGWVTDAQNMRSYKRRTIELIENEDEALKEFALSLGSSPEDVLKDLVLEKLSSDGFI